MRYILFVVVLSIFTMVRAQDATSAFYPAPLKERARANAEKSEWGRKIRDELIHSADPWMKMSDDELWNSMFGPTISRSWMVWSNGYCPKCKQPVPMYDWIINGVVHPWKVQCPHCHELFPKNDFHKYYESGLDEHSVFDPKKADRSLLFNAEHPDPKDPLHMFGVDDGEGYVEGNNRWRFIGTYLIFGQWKQVITSGAKNLAAAYVMTGDEKYAHKAGILLDRIADLYPTFDFRAQGYVYEIHQGTGYVSIWHDACLETRYLAMTYDAIKPAIAHDTQLADFLEKKHEQFKTPQDKSTPAKVMANIEDRILREAIKNHYKIESNYPQTPLTLAVCTTALGGKDNYEAAMKILDPALETSTSVDGTTGEKGLANYSAYAAYTLAPFLGYYAQANPDFLPEMCKRHPNLPKMWRFFIDTWCLHDYYPLEGDTGWVAGPQPTYMGVLPSKDHGLAVGDPSYAHGIVAPSMYSFLWQLYKITNDTAFAQLLPICNGHTTDGLPFDLFADNPEKLQQELAEVLKKHGEKIHVDSVNKTQWHLAILRSGEGENRRALWLDYDSGGRHGHFDGLNLGLFAKGLDLMPDFGYPPVQFGGWGSTRAQWYVSTAAHNTVVVDGVNQVAGDGVSTLWAPGKNFSAITASAPAVVPGAKQFERTAASVNIDDQDAYIVDIFRVVGGHDHTKFFQSHFGTITTSGLNLSPGEQFGNPELMRDFQTDAKAQPGWSVDWKIDDKYKLLPSPKDLHVRYTDLTKDAIAGTCQAWCVAGTFNSLDEYWLQRAVVRRKSAQAPLASTFVSVIEPYENQSKIASIRRLPLQNEAGEPCGDNCVAIEVKLKNGSSDLIVALDADNPLKIVNTPTIDQPLVLPDWNLKLTGRLAWLRRDANGKLVHVALCGAKGLTVGDEHFAPKTPGGDLEQ